MRRREFIAGLGAAAWPVVAQAQELDGPMRRIAMLFGGGGPSESNPRGQVLASAFREALAKLGWVEGRNLKIDLRFDNADADRTRSLAAEQVKTRPEVIVVNSTLAARAAQQHTKSTPIVFVAVNDPVSTGLVTKVARSAGNATGFANYEPSFGGKWLELLKEGDPRISRIAIIYTEENHPQISSGAGYATSIAAAAAPFQ